MDKKHSMKTPLAVALGAAVVGSLSTLPAANADQNPFGLTELSSGYMAAAEGACGEEGKCGEDKDKDKEGKCGEGKCGEKE